jgi:PrtD family type I secretion system ABC transporter
MCQSARAGRGTGARTPVPMKTADLTLTSTRTRGLLWAVALFSLFSNLLMLTGPLFMLQVYDRVLASRSEETLVALFALVTALYLLYGLLEFARTRVLARIAARLHSALAPRVFRASLDRAARGGPGGAAGAAVQDLDTLRTALGSGLVLALVDLPWTVLFLAAIFLFHPALGWIAVAGGATLLAVALANQWTTARRTLEAQRHSQRAQTFAQQAEDASDYAGVQGMAPALTARWSAEQDAALDRATAAGDGGGLFLSFSRAFRFFLQSAILAAGALLVLRGELTAGAMIAASILLGRALAPVEIAIAQWPLGQRARAARSSLAALLEAEPAPVDPTPLPRPEARLEVTGVTVVSRAGDPPILRSVSFTLAPGEALGLIGRSGSGKTTLARVVTGLVRPAAGEVRLGGATLPQYGADGLGRHIGYLPQEVRFFDGTVAENIARMDLAPDPDRVVAAARAAHVHDIILNLPDGYDTRLGPADRRLSGGQRQRLALARALYGDPVLLVLDEPNSALDAEGSEALNAVVTAMKAEGRAVLIMTHRPTAISACDRLLVLDGGRVAALGPRDEIIRSMLKNAGDVQRVVGGQAT